MSGSNTQTLPGLITNAGQIAASDTSTVADIDFGAQLGYGPNLPNIDGSTPMCLSPIVAVVTHAPTMFANIPYATQTLKALVERHAKDISGIDFGYQLEGTGTPVGQDGQELHMPTNSKRTAVTPTFTYQELKGNLIWNFYKNWIWMIKQPDTQASSLAAINVDATLSPVLMSSFTMDTMFIQFDETMRPENIIDAWFVTNMWPQETGMFGAKRQIGRSEIIERQIAHYGVLQHNRNTKTAGQIVAQALGLHRVNFDFATPIATAPDANLAAMGLEAAAQLQSAVFTDLDAVQFGGSGDPTRIA